MQDFETALLQVYSKTPLISVKYQMCCWQKNTKNSRLMDWTVKLLGGTTPWSVRVAKWWQYICSSFGEVTDDWPTLHSTNNLIFFNLTCVKHWVREAAVLIYRVAVNFSIYRIFRLDFQWIWGGGNNYHFTLKQQKITRWLWSLFKTPILSIK